MGEFVFADDGSPAHHREGFVRVYRQVFAELPYLETYTDEEAIEFGWDPNVKCGGVVILYLEAGEVAGFGCAVPIEQAEDDVKAFVESWKESAEYPFELGGLWYFSELGILPEYRGRGMGYELIKQRILHIQQLGSDWYLMRTALERSNSIDHYRNIGAQRISVQEVPKDKAEKIGTKSKERIYLYGSCAHALELLRQKKLGIEEKAQGQAI